MHKMTSKWGLMIVTMGVALLSACSKKDDVIVNTKKVSYYVKGTNAKIDKVSFVNTNGNTHVNLNLKEDTYKITNIDIDPVKSNYLSLTALGMSDSTKNGSLYVAIILDGDTVATNTTNSAELISTSTNYEIK